MTEAWPPPPVGSAGVAHVIIIPLSGLVNRLQAMASATILARQTGARLSVCWQRQRAADIDAPDVFDADYCDAHLMTAEQLRAETGIDADNVPAGLAHHDGIVTLAGHTRGEQVYMSELASIINGLTTPTTLVIRAGGKYILPGTGRIDASSTRDRRQSGPSDDLSTFRELRREWYQRIPLKADILATAEATATNRQPTMGLHLRYTDRSHQAPRDAQIERAIRVLAERTGLTTMLIASDTPARRDRWGQRLNALGISPWHAEHVAMDRTSVAGAHGALIDFLLLARTAGMVYFAESSFGEEAAVASGAFDVSIGLPTSRAVTATAAVRQLATSAVTYPKRHGWLR